MAPVLYHMGGFPPENIDLGSLAGLIGRANAALARFDGLVTAMPNANVLLSPLTTQEAVLSSKIEGTQVTMGEVLEYEAGGGNPDKDPERRNDAEEVRNYRFALINASNELSRRGISLHLIRQIHALLLRGVRGESKAPGQFRDEQNWIGAAGCTIEDASFVPIPQEHLRPGLDRWQNFLSDPKPVDPLVQLSLIHLEFEALHPFKDGNGRLGRMIIPLYLAERGVLSGPHFYMSGYLEEQRESYVALMRDVSRSGAWTQWIRFFLEGIEQQAALNQDKAVKILALYNDMLHSVSELTHSQYSAKAVDYFFSRPVFSSSVYVEDCGIPKPTALRMLSVLRDAGLLAVVRAGSGRRPGIYAFGKLINIAEGRSVV